MAATTSWVSAMAKRRPRFDRMAQGDGVADLCPQIVGSLRASRILGAVGVGGSRAGLDRRCPRGAVEIDELDEEIEVVVGSGRERRGGQAQSCIDVPDVGSVGDGHDDRGVAGRTSSSWTTTRSASPLVNSASPCSRVRPKLSTIPSTATSA